MATHFRISFFVFIRENDAICDRLTSEQSPLALLLLYLFVLPSQGLLTVAHDALQRNTERDVFWYYIRRRRHDGYFTNMNQVKQLLFSLLCYCSLTLILALNSSKESSNYAALVATRLKSVFSTRNLTIAQHAAKLSWLNIRKIINLFSLQAMAVRKTQANISYA